MAGQALSSVPAAWPRSGRGCVHPTHPCDRGHAPPAPGHGVLMGTGTGWERMVAPPSPGALAWARAVPRSPRLIFSPGVHGGGAGLGLICPGQWQTAGPGATITEFGCSDGLGVPPAYWVHQRYPCANEAIASILSTELPPGTNVPLEPKPTRSSWLKDLWVMPITLVGCGQAGNSGHPI